MIELWIAIIGLLSVFVGGILGVVSSNFDAFKYMLPKRWRKETNFGQVVSTKLHLDTLARLLQNRANINKAVLIHVSNGGTVLKPEGLFYGTIINPTEFTHTFNKQALDNEYIQMVQDIYQEGKTIRNVRDLKPDGLLRPLLITQKVSETHCYHVKEIHNKNNFCYIFLAVDVHMGATLNDEDNDAIRNVISQIQNIL